MLPPATILAIAQGDAVALTMMAIFGFSLGMILTILIVMARNAGKRPDHTAEFEDEDDEPTPRTKAGDPPGERREDWERDANWWKD